MALIFKTSRAWEALGFASFGQYCEEGLGISERAIAQRVSLERSLQRIPLLREALQQKRITYEKARVLARHAEPDSLPGLIDKAAGMTCVALRRDLEAKEEAQMCARNTVSVWMTVRVAEVVKAAFRAARALAKRWLAPGECLGLVGETAFTQRTEEHLLGDLPLQHLDLGTAKLDDLARLNVDQVIVVIFAAGTARKLGAAAVFAFPLTIGAIRAGVMGLYRGSPGPLASTQLGDCLLLGDAATVLLLGDLSLYHDMNGLWALQRHGIRATLVVCDNNGGGVFNFLPQAEHQDVFEEIFATPLGLDLSQVARLYGLVYSPVSDRSGLEPAETFSHRFTAPGTYQYFCALHPHMTATVVVR